MLWAILRAWKYAKIFIFFAVVIEAMLSSTQKCVSGKVFVQLLPYRFNLIGIESKHDLMSSKFGSYGEMNNSWSGDDVKGFAKIYSNQMMIWKKVNDQ